jgi:hypothetical protein
LKKLPKFDTKAPVKEAVKVEKAPVAEAAEAKK